MTDREKPLSEVHEADSSIIRTMDKMGSSFTDDFHIQSSISNDDQRTVSVKRKTTCSFLRRWFCHIAINNFSLILRSK